jgi:hypothetical protein
MVEHIELHFAGIGLCNVSENGNRDGRFLVESLGR